MRVDFHEQLRLDCLPIESVVFNRNCRDEIIPILRALQHIYEDARLRGELLGLVGRDVNGASSSKHGREGWDYWTILVLASVCRTKLWSHSLPNSGCRNLAVGTSCFPNSREFWRTRTR